MANQLQLVCQLLLSYINFLSNRNLDLANGKRVTVDPDPEKKKFLETVLEICKCTPVFNLEGAENWTPIPLMQIQLPLLEMPENQDVDLVELIGGGLEDAGIRVTKHSDDVLQVSATAFFKVFKESGIDVSDLQKSMDAERANVKWLSKRMQQRRADRGDDQSNSGPSR